MARKIRNRGGEDQVAPAPEEESKQEVQENPEVKALQALQPESGSPRANEIEKEILELQNSNVGGKKNKSRKGKRSSRRSKKGGRKSNKVSRKSAKKSRKSRK
jgi:hypothetical protein